MEIALATNDAAKVLKFGNLKRLDDGSSYAADLTICSGPFRVENFSFYFEPPVLEAFIAALKQMNRTLSGAAILKPLFEDQKICLEILSTGSVWVSGTLQRFAERTEALTFAFLTDQTCLNGLIAGFEKCRDLTAESGI